MTRTAIVTGASRGVGRGIARVLAAEADFKVFATARNQAALDGLKKEVEATGCNGQIIPHSLDQNNDEEVVHFVETILKSVKKIDLIFNSDYKGLMEMKKNQNTLKI